MPGRLSQASGFRQQGKHNRTSGAERSEIRREAVRPPPLQDAAPCPGLAHPGFHSKSSFVCFPVPSHQPMKIHRIIPEEPKKATPAKLVVREPGRVIAPVAPVHMVGTSGAENRPSRKGALRAGVG